MIRRSFALCLAALLLLALAPAAAAGAETGAAPVVISTAEQFLQFASNCSRESYSLGRRFVLKNDIDLTGLDYCPAGYFAGEFDGGGHTVRGLSLEAAGSRLGLFRRIAAGATVENLKVEGGVRPDGSGEYVGGLVGFNEGSVENCSFSGDVRAVRFVGGIAGYNASSGTVRGCGFSGFLIGEHQVGGIAGRNEGVLSDCKSAGEVNSVFITPRGERSFDLAALSQEDFVNLADIGGIVGDNSGVVEACLNRAAVGYPYSGYNVGGIAGKSSGFLYACVNEGTVDGRRDVGGVLGQLIPCAAWELSGGQLEELSQAVSYMNYLLSSLNQNADSYSSSVRAQLESMNSSTLQTVYALEDVVAQLAASDTSLFEGITVDPETGLLIIPNLGQQNVDFSQLNLALYGMVEQAGAVAELARSGIEALGDNLQDVSNQMSYILNLIFAALQDGDGGLIEQRDLSFSEAYDHSEGAVENCSSRGSIHGETNVGGVAGSSAFELSFDMEGLLSSSPILPTHAEQMLFAAIRGCKSSGEVRSRNDNAGGIVGSVETGAVVDCIATGQILSQNGSCVGGVAGRSEGTVARCWSRSSLEGQSYLGGIAGLGTDVLECRAWVHIERGSEYLGAVAGWAEGEVRDNFYVDGRPDGVDGVSLLGQAEPLGQAAFLALDGAPKSFDTVTVRFVSEGETVETLELPFGAAVESLPQMPRQDSAYWVWDAFDADGVYSDLEIGGNYVRPDTTLSSGEEPPLFLAEGEFYEDQSLHVMPFTPQWEGEECLGGYTLAVNDYRGALTVRMRSEESVGVWKQDANDIWTEIPSERDGRYLVFQLENGGSFAVVREMTRERVRLLRFGVPAALLLIITVITVRILRRRRRRAEDGPARRNRSSGGKHMK